MVGVSGQDGSFGDGLAAAARSIIADARRALTDPELADPEAVHEVRKALKRWRALLRLLARPLGEPANQMRTEARELMRSLSGARANWCRKTGRAPSPSTCTISAGAWSSTATRWI